MTCNHDRYRADNYVSDIKAMAMMKAGEICRIGMVITHCADCGADISHGRRVQVKTVEQVLSDI